MTTTTQTSQRVDTDRRFSILHLLYRGHSNTVLKFTTIDFPSHKALAVTLNV